MKKNRLVVLTCTLVLGICTVTGCGAKNSAPSENPVSKTEVPANGETAETSTTEEVKEAVEADLVGKWTQADAKPDEYFVIELKEDGSGSVMTEPMDIGVPLQYEVDGVNITAHMGSIDDNTPMTYLPDTDQILYDDVYYNRGEAVFSEDSTESDVSAETVLDEVVFSTDDYLISYYPDCFEQIEARGAVEFIYNKDGVKTAGSNEILITKEEGTTVDELMSTIVKSRGVTEDEVSEVTVGPNAIPGKSIVDTQKAKDSDADLVDTVILVQSGDNVISIEIIRTIGTDEESEMTIDGAFTHTFESFELN